jgi:predicted O-methyltransferase YrrM
MAFPDRLEQIGAIARRSMQGGWDSLHLRFWPPPYDGMQTRLRMRFLYDMVVRHGRVRHGRALEIGCYRGCSTLFLAKACARKGIHHVSSIDLFTGTPGWDQAFDTYEDAQRRMKAYGLGDSVTLIRSNSQTCDWSDPVDILHLDGDHEYDAVRDDIEKYVRFLDAEGLVVFDDYDQSHPGVQKAVHELLGQGKFEVLASHHEDTEEGSICLRRLPV